MRLLSLSGPDPRAALAHGVAATVMHYAPGGMAPSEVTAYQANVERDRVMAHAAFRNVFLITTLDVVRRDLCLLWPHPLALEDVEFADVASGEALSESACKGRVMRRLLDGEISLSIHGVPVRVLDPRGCVPK